MKRRLFLFSMLVPTAVSVTGCSGKPTKRPKGSPVAYPAHGVVTMDGQPLAEATIVLQAEGGGPAASAISDAEGKFVLTTYDPMDGAPAGDYSVIVMQYEKFVPPPGYNAETSAPLKPPKLISPAKYSEFTQSGLKAHIGEQQDNVIELQLVSNP